MMYDVLGQRLPQAPHGRKHRRRRRAIAEPLLANGAMRRRHGYLAFLGAVANDHQLRHATVATDHLRRGQRHNLATRRPAGAAIRRTHANG